MNFSNQINSNMSVKVLKNNLRSLASSLKDSNREEQKEIYKSMTYYSQILYCKVSFEEFSEFEAELDGLR